MNAKHWTLAILLGTSLTCLAQSDSLGDLARQQKNAARPKAKRVITDENLPKASPMEAANGAIVVPKAASDGANADKPAAEAKANAPAAAPAATVAPGDAQKRLDEIKSMEEAAQRAIKKFESELNDQSVNAEMRQTFEEGLAKAKQLLAEATKERQGIEQAISQAVAPPANPDKVVEPAATQNDSTPKEAEAKRAEKSDGN